MKNELIKCNSLTFMLQTFLFLNRIQFYHRFSYLYKPAIIMDEQSEKKGFKAVIVGSSGSTGNYLFTNLIKTQAFSEIVSLGRRRVTGVNDGINLEMEESSGRVKQEIIDFEDLTNETVGKHFTDADVYFSCLGTTKKNAGSAERFRHIDFDYNYNLAKVAKENNVKLFSLMSSQGGDKNSMFLYLRVKGELEEECRSLKFPSYTVFKPGFLDRGESSRFVEKIAGFFVSRLPTETVARAMCSNALQHLMSPPNKAAQEHIYYNDHIQHMSDTFDLGT